MYDCIIIGAGPAGMTAAIYTARKNLKTLVLGKLPGGQMVWSADVENYTGFSLITGADLTLKFEEHLATLKQDLEIKYGTEVTSLDRNITSFVVEDSTSAVYYGRSVIIASGKVPRHLGIPGEEKFFGKGLSTCATCDGPLYRGKDVAVIGGGNSALDALLSLSRVARRVTSVNVNPELIGDAILKNKVLACHNIQFFNNTKTLEVLGDKNVTGLRVQQLGSAERQILVNGVFVEVGYTPSNSFDHLTEKNEQGEIKVDQNLQSSVPGIFAAGDINNAWGEQIIIAAGEGAKAAMAVSKYLNGVK